MAERVERRLAAILAADVVGYSRLMERDEGGTLSRLRANQRDIIEPCLAKHGGRLVKLMGDGSLIEFRSVIDALSCALEIQAALAGAEPDQPEANRFLYRIGVNLGDVIVEGDDIYGEGVNVASRLQTLARPGGIAIPHAVLDHVQGKIAAAFEDLGQHQIKNIERPLHVFAVTAPSARPSPAGDSTPKATRLAIAVLPFTNMSGDPEQEYFSDGITEDIITDLSKVGALAVTARNTTFALKGKAMDVGEAARQLRVSHVLEGSVRKSGARVRISAQLIDGATGHHLWAERYDRDLDDIFALQDEIARAIVDALKIKLMPAERAGIGQRTTENVEAYQYYLMGRQHTLRMGRRNQLSARRHYQRAIEIDPDYARAHAGLALAEGWILNTGDASASLATLRLEADRALAMDPTLAEAHVADGLAHFFNGKLELAIEASRRAVVLDPNLYEAHMCLGHALRMDRQFDAALRAYERAAELDRNSYDALAMAVDCRKSLGDEAGARALAVESLTRIEKAMLLYPDDAAAYAHGCNAL